jgi:two-component system chemotaxis response regulator CheB
VTGRDRGAVVVIGASAGGVETLCQLVKRLPADFSVPILVVLHLAPYGSALPQILTRCGPLEAAHPVDGERLTPGCIRVAPPDHHLIVCDGKIGLTRGPKENGVRPSIDTMFRTAVHDLGRRVIAVVLSGTLDDGTAGMRVVRERGGATVVQDPDDALFSSMPASAVRYAHPDHVVPLAELAPLLVRLAAGLSDRRSPHEEELVEIDDSDAASASEQEGELTELTCPDCGGSLWEISGEAPRYHCRVGHSYSPESLVTQQSAALEEAMWAAVVALEERADLSERMSRRASQGHRHALAARYSRQSADARRRAEVVRSAIPGLDSDVSGEEELT